MRETLSSHRIVGRRNLALAAAFVSLWWLPCECAAVPGSAGSPAAPQPAPTSGPSEAERVASHRRDHWRRVALTAEHIDSEPVAHDLPLYIDRYRQACIYDPILTVYRVEAKPTGADHPTSVSLEGEVLLDWYRTGTERMLRELGFDVTTNTVALLPDGRLGPLRYAVATTVSATMRRRPMMDAEQVNSLALGWPMRLLREAVPEDAVTTGGAAGPLPHGGHSWFLAQGCDGYVGFVRDDQLSRTATYRLPDAVVTKPAELREGDETYCVPVGSALYARRSATGKTQYVAPVLGREIRALIEPDGSRPADARMTSSTILQAAEPVMGTRYFWGGVTEEGIDCSGFTQLIYKILGVYLPRDSRPQSVVGNISAFGADVARDAEAGDLVYFCDESGRISHIGIALGEGRLIHSSGGAGVHVCGYDETSPGRPRGMIERVLYSRRVLMR